MVVAAGRQRGPGELGQGGRGVSEGRPKLASLPPAAVARWQPWRHLHTSLPLPHDDRRTVLTAAPVPACRPRPRKIPSSRHEVLGAIHMVWDAVRPRRGHGRGSRPFAAVISPRATDSRPGLQDAAGEAGSAESRQSVLTNAQCQSNLTAMDSEETPNSGTPRDPAVGLRAVLALRRLTERVEAEQVARARAQGWSWQQIADGLGMTRQSVHAKYGGSRS